MLKYENYLSNKCLNRIIFGIFFWNNIMKILYKARGLDSLWNIIILWLPIMLSVWNPFLLVLGMDSSCLDWDLFRSPCSHLHHSSYCIWLPCLCVLNLDASNCFFDCIAPTNLATWSVNCFGQFVLSTYSRW